MAPNLAAKAVPREKPVGLDDVVRIPVGMLVVDAWLYKRKAPVP